MHPHHQDMKNENQEAPEGYRFPFPTPEDAYGLDDYSEDSTHFATLAQTGASLRSLANNYFRAHYPPADRAQRCLNLFWAIESFLTRHSDPDNREAHGCIPRWERGAQEAWKYYSGCRYGDVITDDMAIVEVTNIMLADEK
jgi:hypothetical protein